MKSDRTYWFAPKRLGIGYSPSTWQGWALVAVYGALMFSVPRFLRADGNARIGAMIGLTIAFLALAFSKTDTSKP